MSKNFKHHYTFVVTDIDRDVVLRRLEIDTQHPISIKDMLDESAEGKSRKIGFIVESDSFADADDEEAEERPEEDKKAKEKAEEEEIVMKTCLAKDEIASGDDVLKTIIRHYGVEHQITKAIEEMSELTKVLTKILEDNNGRKKGEPFELRSNYWVDLIEEMADVRLLLQQINVIFRINFADQLMPMVSVKLLRTLARIEDEKG